MDLLTDHIGKIVIALLLCLLTAVVYGAYDEFRAEKFYLRKDSWTCTKSHLVATQTMVLVGKALIPIITTHTECDRWDRR